MKHINCFEKMKKYILTTTLGLCFLLVFLLTSDATMQNQAETTSEQVSVESTRNLTQAEKTDAKIIEVVKVVKKKPATVTVKEEAVAKSAVLSKSDVSVKLSEIPVYEEEPYVEINGNVPGFASSELVTSSFENYSKKDSLGRCGVAYAAVGKDIMPTKERGKIGSVKPTGWQTVKYASVDGKYLYNRCHLIGYQLTGENANKRNLITGTRSMNVDGMLPFENMVADYVKETNNHVLYRVTPIYDGKNLLASGVQMEAFSVEDDGDGICFNVFCYNVQPGITIDYATGKSALNGEEVAKTETKKEKAATTKKTETAAAVVVEPVPVVDAAPAPVAEATPAPAPVVEVPAPAAVAVTEGYVLNNNTMKFHKPSCSSAGEIKESNKGTYAGSRDDLIAQGYVPCKRCNP